MVDRRQAGRSNASGFEVSSKVVFPPQEIRHLDAVSIAVNAVRHFNEEPFSTTWAEARTHPEHP
ncbi:MAG: hypothetical protein ACJAXA_003793 [Candidatus Aldehydirespiratoraceae bacterium]